MQPIVELRQDVPPLPADVLELAEFVAKYYQEPLGLVLAQMLPPLAAVSRKPRPSRAAASTRDAEHPGAGRAVSLNPEQARAAAGDHRSAGSFAPFLLQGVTGSGKTEVYLAAAAAAIAAGGQVLILVPEINLTPQFRQRIADALPSEEDGDAAQPASRRASACAIGAMPRAAMPISSWARGWPCSRRCRGSA